MEIKIALAGNPNCGKTTLFNELTGSAQYVGNWPGVTVEKKDGRLKGHKDVIIQDLPGIYSLSPYTLEVFSYPGTRLVTRQPILSAFSIHCQEHLFFSSQSSSAVGIRQSPPRTTLAASSSRSSVVLQSTGYSGL